ncbi:MAG: hypothetical protein J3K34DRAFT_148185 [Monoraphidium minutum]|nr:MAG: hypothetical protein J3K34DRAFT_148185 [Monoraphidium minutum]
MRGPRGAGLTEGHPTRAAHATHTRRVTRGGGAARVPRFFVAFGTRALGQSVRLNARGGHPEQRGRRHRYGPGRNAQAPQGGPRGERRRERRHAREGPRSPPHAPALCTCARERGGGLGAGDNGRAAAGVSTGCESVHRPWRGQEWGGARPAGVQAAPGGGRRTARAAAAPRTLRGAGAAGGPPSTWRRAVFLERGRRIDQSDRDGSRPGAGLAAPGGGGGGLFKPTHRCSEKREVLRRMRCGEPAPRRACGPQAQGCKQPGPGAPRARRRGRGRGRQSGSAQRWLRGSSGWAEALAPHRKKNVRVRERRRHLGGMRPAGGLALPPPSIAPAAAGGARGGARGGTRAARGYALGRRGAGLRAAGARSWRGAGARGGCNRGRAARPRAGPLGRGLSLLTHRVAESSAAPC